MPPRKRPAARRRRRSSPQETSQIGGARRGLLGPPDARGPPLGLGGLVWLAKAVVMSHTAFFFGGDSLPLGLACMLLLACSNGWLLLVSVVACVSALTVAMLWDCTDRRAEAVATGLPTCNAVLLGGLVALTAAEGASQSAVLEAAAAGAAVATVLDAEAGRLLAGRGVMLGSLVWLAVAKVYRSGAQAWVEPALHYRGALDYRGALETPVLSTIAEEMETRKSLVEAQMTEALLAVPEMLGPVITGVASFAFAPPPYAVPLTLIWLAFADPAVPFGVWVGCAVGLCGEALSGAAVGAAGVGPSTAGLNGSLAFAVVHCFYFRACWQPRALVVAAMAASAAGATAQSLGGTWSSCLVLIAAQLLRGRFPGLWPA